MTDEITVRPAEQQHDMKLVAKKPQTDQKPAMQQQAQKRMQANMAGGYVCHQCGTVNDPEAKYCASCGALLHMDTCPNCGNEIEPDADFCEVCHHYIRPDVCSFCGAKFNENDPYCPECGSPRGGIVCPVCNTLNDFAFCKQCGQALTEEARQVMEKLRQMPEYQEMVHIAREYNELQMQLPFSNDEDVRRYERSQKLREHVLRLLAEDMGVPEPEIPPVLRSRQSQEELDESKKQKLEQLTRILERMAVPPSTSPAKVRNYAMAQKPMGVRLAWMCNYKHALHSSPCGCAKPQMGGKWVVLGHNSKQEITDDK